MKKRHHLSIFFAVFSISIFVFTFVSIILAEDTPGEQIKYVGVEKCKSCHPAEYQDFSQRKFSKSWRVLKMRNEANNPECLKCHVTGAKRPGGFVSEEATPHLTGKQCEACHGPGEKHVNDPGNVELREKMLVSQQNKNICLECHLCMTTHRGVGF